MYLCLVEAASFRRTLFPARVPLGTGRVFNEAACWPNIVVLKFKKKKKLAHVFASLNETCSCSASETRSSRPRQDPAAASFEISTNYAEAPPRIAARPHRANTAGRSAALDRSFIFVSSLSPISLLLFGKFILTFELRCSCYFLLKEI